MQDHCGNILPAPVPVASIDPACQGQKTYTYTYTDCAGLSFVWVYTYTIERSVDPFEDYIIDPVAIEATVECASEAVVPTLPVVKDICGNTLPAPIPVVSANPLCNGQKTYTYTYTDCAGLSFVWAFTYTIERVTPPTEFGTPVATTATVECESLAVAPALPVVKDVCGNTLTAPAPVMSGTYTTCEGSIIYTYNYTDCAGLPFTWTFTYTIDHTSVPVVPANGTATVQCIIDAVTPTVPVVTDVCGVAITPVLNIVENPGPLVTEGTRTYIYTYTDCSGLSSVWQFEYTIDDNIAPVVTGCPATITIQTGAGRTTCDKNYTWTAPSVTDNCSSLANIAITWTITGATTGSGTGNLNSYVFNKGTSTVSYTFTDAAGNANTTCTFNVTVVDNTPPVITCPAPVIVNLPPNQCTANPVIIPPTLSDNCGVANIILTLRSDGQPLGSPFGIGSHTITYIAVDDNFNSSNCTQIVLVTGTTTITITCPPTLVLNNDPGQCSKLISQLYWLEPANQPTQLGCGAVTFGKIRGDGLTFADPFPVGETTVTWRAINGLGEIVDECEQIVRIVDNENPVITCPANVEVGNDAGLCGATITITTPVPTDNCGVLSIVNDFNNTSNASGFYPVGTTTVTWTVTDIHNNVSTCQQIVKVNDVQQPVIACPVAVNADRNANTGVCTYTAVADRV